MKRMLLLIGGVAASIALSKLLIENVLGMSLEPLAVSWIADAGASGAATIVALLTIDLLLPVPSSLVMILSGAAFGVLWGSVLSLAGSLGGAVLGFELGRRYGQGAVARFAGGGDAGRIRQALARHGIAAVVVTRALPVVMETMNVVAGLSTMKRSAFLAAAAAGTAPIVVVYAYAGAVSRETGSLVPAIVMLAAVVALGWVVYRAKIAPASKSSFGASRG